eukprot:COSAG01_NODE_6183_length_3804_cov_14.985965_2_plen_671_part_00
MRRTAAALLLMLSALPTGGAAGATAAAAGAPQTAAGPEVHAREEVLWQAFNDLKTRLAGVEVDFELEKGNSRRLEGEVGRLRARVEVLESREGHGSSSSVDRRRLGDSPGETQIIHKRRLAYQQKCAGPGEQNGECPYGCVCSPPTWPNCGTVPPPDCSGRHRRTQKAEVCTEAEVPQRLNAINWECCDETTESCRSGTPETCNIGCAAVVLPFWAECRAPFIRTVPQGTVDTFREVVDKCQRNESAAEKKPLATEFALVCESHNVANCIPNCTEALHGDILLATVDGDDSAYTCEVHHGMYSWNGKAGAGGFMGSDILSFIASVLSGAGGFYAALVLENNAHVDVELLVQPQQSVSIRGDPGVQSDGGGSQPIWGRGGFTVQQYGSLTVKNLLVQGDIIIKTGGEARLMHVPLPLDDSGGGGGSIDVRGGGSLTLEVDPATKARLDSLLNFWWRLHQINGLPAFTVDAAASFAINGQETPDNPGPRATYTNWFGAWLYRSPQSRGGAQCYRHYTNLSDAWRHISATSNNQTDARDTDRQTQTRGCGQWVPTGVGDEQWYRFVGPFGEPYALPTTSPGHGHCGSLGAGWLSAWDPQDGQPPHQYNTAGVYPRDITAPPTVATVCFDDGFGFAPCSYAVTVAVALCDGFFLWQLPYAPSCSAGYCTTASGL